MVKWKDVLGKEHLLMEGKGDDVFHVIPSQYDDEGNSFTQIISREAMVEYIKETQIMSFQDIELTSTNRLQLDLMEIPSSCVIVICDGKAKLRELPPYGEYKIVTHQGKVKRMRREEGEEF